MAVIKYDVSDVPAGGGGEQPQPALYKGKIVSMKPRKKKANGDPVSDLEIVVDVGSEYARLWTYVKLPDDPDFGPSAWKFRELTDALDLPPKGGIDPAKVTKEQPDVNVKVAPDKDQEGNYRGKVKNLFKPTEGGETTNGVEADITDSADASDPTSLAYYEGWTEEDYKAELEEKGLTVSGRFSADKARDALIEAAGGSAEETEADEQHLTDGYDEWTLEDLQKEVDEKGISGNITGRKTREKYIEALRSLAEGPAATQDEAEAEAPVDDYDEWTKEELEQEIADRNADGAEIKITGRVDEKKMIAALREDNVKSEPF